MTSKCCECGHVYEGNKPCPKCGGAPGEAYQCKSCEKVFYADELYRGYCVNCVIEMMDKATMMQFLEDNNLEAEFYVGVYYQSDVNNASQDLINLTKGGWLQRVSIEHLVGARERAMEDMRNYILDSDCGIYDFLDWLEAKKRGN